MDTTTSTTRTYTVDFGELHRKLGLPGEQKITSVKVKADKVIVETREES
jgi:hypothetical protein